MAAAASHTQRAGAHTDSRISREYAAQLKRNLPVIAVGLAMLVTLFLPWMIIPDGTESTFVMSWDIIGGDQPAGVFVAFLIGSWIIGLTAVIVGFCLSGLPLSILKTGLGLVGIILLLVVATEFLAASRSVPFLPISGRIVLIIMEGIFLLALLIGTHLRLRLGGALWLRILQGAPAGILAILTIISLFTMISDYVRIPNVLRKELTGDMLFFCFLHVGSVAACVLGLVHAAHLKLKSRALVVATPLLIYSVIAMQCLYLLIRPALAESRAAGVVFLVLNAILLVGSISFLLCSGIINSVCDVVKGYGVG